MILEFDSTKSNRKMHRIDAGIYDNTEEGKIIDFLSKMLESGKISMQDIEDTQNEQIMEVLEMNRVVIPKVQMRQRGGNTQYFVNVPTKYSLTGI